MLYVIFMKLPLLEMCGFTILAPVLKGSSKNTPFFSPYFVNNFWTAEPILTNETILEYASQALSV